MTLELDLEVSDTPRPEEAPAPPTAPDVELPTGLVLDSSIASLNARLQILGKLIPLLSLRSDFKLLINKIQDLCMEAVNCEAGSILEVDEKKGDLFFVAARGEKAEDVLKFRVPMGKGIAGYCAETSETLAVSDVQKDPRFFKEISDALKFETRSILCMPINIRGKVYGVIEWINKRGNDIFTADDLELLREIAHGAGALIENYRVMQKYERRLKALASILEHVPQLGAAKSLFECARSVMSTASEITQADAAFLLLTDGTRHSLYSCTPQGFGDPVAVKEEQSPFLEVLRTQRTALRQKTEADGELHLPPDLKVAAQLRSVYCVPLIHGGATAGVLGLGTASAPSVGADEQKVLMALGIVASSSLGRFLKRDTRAN